MTPEERLIRTLEASLASYERERGDAPDPEWLEAYLADVREAIADWRRVYPRTDLPPDDGEQCR